MPAARVVPALDEVEDAEAGLGRRWEALPIEQLALEGCEEALAEGVVVGVTHAAHRGPDPGLATPEPRADRGRAPRSRGRPDPARADASGPGASSAAASAD